MPCTLKYKTLVIYTSESVSAGRCIQLGDATAACQERRAGSAASRDHTTPTAILRLADNDQFSMVGVGVCTDCEAQAIDGNCSSDMKQ